MQTLTVKLPDKIAQEIAAEARRRRVSKSEVMRERLSSVAGKTKPSLWDRMKHLVIKSDALPRDLSSNKKHMEDYGKTRADRQRAARRRAA